MDAELYLRLLIEDAVRAPAADFQAVSSHLQAIATNGRAMVAVGALDADEVASVVADTALALFLRGADWLETVLTDLPSVPIAPDAFSDATLVSVLAQHEGLVEVWDKALVVRPAASAPWTTHGGLPVGHERLEVRTAAGTVVFDLTAASPARTVEAVTRALDVVDLLLTWAIVTGRTGANRSARPDPGSPVFEPLGLVAGDAVLLAIEHGRVLHARWIRPPTVAWIRSPAGFHVISEGENIEPPVPPPPASLVLVAVDDGVATEVALR